MRISPRWKRASGRATRIEPVSALRAVAATLPRRRRTIARVRWRSAPGARRSRGHPPRNGTVGGGGRRGGSAARLAGGRAAATLLFGVRPRSGTASADPGRAGRDRAPSPATRQRAAPCIEPVSALREREGHGAPKRARSDASATISPAAWPFTSQDSSSTTSSCRGPQAAAGEAERQQLRTNVTRGLSAAVQRST